MECVIVYWSRYGHGKKLVDFLVERLEENDWKVISETPEKLDPKNMPESDLYVFSSPTEAFRIKRDMRKFMKKIEGLDNRPYGIINTHFMKKNWLKNMEKILSKKKNMNKLAEIDFRIERDKAEKKEGLPENWVKDLKKFSDQLI